MASNTATDTHLIDPDALRQSVNPRQLESIATWIDAGCPPRIEVRAAAEALRSSAASVRELLGDA